MPRVLLESHRLANALICLVAMSGCDRTAVAETASAPRHNKVAGQPLAANVERIVRALEILGHPFNRATLEELRPAIRDQDAVAIQDVIDPHVLFVVAINPEQRVKVDRGPAQARLHQGGYTPFLVKVLNDATAAESLRVRSPSGGAVYGGESKFSLERQQQTELASPANSPGDARRFLDLEVCQTPPLTNQLNGLEVEYVLVLIASTEAGRREAIIQFDIGQGTQDLGFRSEVPVLFDVQPAIPVRLSIRDTDGTPTTARLTIRDAGGRIHPSQPKRTAPDFFFQPQIYRADGDRLLLSPGEYTVVSCRGPEYVERGQKLIVPSSGTAELTVELERWVEPHKHGFFCGDHHIHGAGCAHYESPTQGVAPADMFRQVKGEGLHVGCVLTWGPCYDFQRRYFQPQADAVSEPMTVVKYDLEISGFGSAPLGHVCLLNLQEQTYPDSEGTKERGWPSWTVPVMRWAKEQGGITGYPHSDMRIDPQGAAQWLLEQSDASRDGRLSVSEAELALLPEPFDGIDRDEDQRLSEAELADSCHRAGELLPNVVPPGMTGAGAMEIFVSVPEGVCDFISAMDTGRVGEWNTWYHLLNCGFLLKVSGETDFPCMSSRRVGKGRVYVQLGRVDAVDFPAWCRGLAQGRSYVSDGYAHALSFQVNGQPPGFDDVTLSEPGNVRISARVAFAREVPEAVAYGTQQPPLHRDVGDTRVLHAPRSDQHVQPTPRLVEIVVNGKVVAKQDVPCDGQPHDLEFQVPLDRSSWVALRQFPQLHTNPVNVIVAGQPIRASRASARWCSQAVDLLWRNRSRFIAESERPAARAAYDRATAVYRQILAESDVE